MTSYSQLEKGIRILIDNIPYEIMEASSMFKGRGQSVLQTRIKNLITGEILSKTFHSSDNFKEAEISKITCKFLYSHRNSYVFSETDSPSKRFNIEENKIKNLLKFLKPNIGLEAIIFNQEVVSVSLPIKINLKVKSAPPGIKGDRAQGGNKTVTLETGGEIAVPLFIEEGDTIEVNTESGEYVRRVEKK